MIRQLWILSWCLFFSLFACRDTGADNDLLLAVNTEHSTGSVQYTPEVPDYAWEVYSYICRFHQPMPGYKGGSHFGNYEGRLPAKTTGGRKAKFKEWDVHPWSKGKSRGPERLVTNQEDNAWYTPDHYRTFIELRQP